MNAGRNPPVSRPFGWPSRGGGRGGAAAPGAGWGRGPPGDPARLDGLEPPFYDAAREGARPEEMKREVVINRHRKDYVLYAGLLDQAHQQGLKAIKTQLVQVPSSENGQVAICLAEVTTEK